MACAKHTHTLARKRWGDVHVCPCVWCGSLREKSRNAVLGLRLVVATPAVITFQLRVDTNNLFRLFLQQTIELSHWCQYLSQVLNYFYDEIDWSTSMLAGTRWEAATQVPRQSRHHLFRMWFSDVAGKSLLEISCSNRIQGMVLGNCLRSQCLSTILYQELKLWNTNNLQDAPNAQVSSYWVLRFWFKDFV